MSSTAKTVEQLKKEMEDLEELLLNTNTINFAELRDKETMGQDVSNYDVSFDVEKIFAQRNNNIKTAYE